MKKFILLLFITFCLLFGAKTGINACIGKPNLESSALEADVVFIGKPVKVESVKSASVGWKGNDTQTPILFTVKAQKLFFGVSEAIKGTTDNTIEVLFQPSSCFGKFSDGESSDFIVFAYKRLPHLSKEETLLPKDIWSKEMKLKAEADNFNQSLPLLEIFAVPLSSIKDNELKVIKM